MIHPIDEVLLMACPPGKDRSIKGSPTKHGYIEFEEAPLGAPLQSQFLLKAVDLKVEENKKHNNAGSYNNEDKNANIFLNKGAEFDFDLIFNHKCDLSTNSLQIFLQKAEKHCESDTNENVSIGFHFTSAKHQVVEKGLWRMESEFQTDSSVVRIILKISPNVETGVWKMFIVTNGFTQHVDGINIVE